MQQFTYFTVKPNFNPQSRNGARCSLSNLIMQGEELGRPSDEVDEFVLSGPMIDYEGDFDIRPSVIRTTARELGMVSAEEHAHQRHQTAVLADNMFDLQAENAALHQELDVLRAAIRGALVTDPSEDVLDQPDTIPLFDVDEYEV